MIGTRKGNTILEKTMKMRLTTALFVALVSQAAAFAPSSKEARLSTKLYRDTKEDPTLANIPLPKDISYGEESRKYRRTVYSHDDWVKHRAPNRFVRNAVSSLTSGVYKNIGNEVLFITGVATAVTLYNAIAGGYTDFSGVQHDAVIAGLPKLGLPLAPFTLSSASLGLLLGKSDGERDFDDDDVTSSDNNAFSFSSCYAVFRTNTGYQRWDEARKNWGMNINHTRDLVRMANAYYDSSTVSPERRKDDLQRVALATWSFVRAMKRHLSPEGDDEEDFKKELHEKLPQKQAQSIIDAAHRPNRALQDLSYAIENLNMHWLRKNEVHKAATIFEDNLGSSERLLTSPVPLFYSRHTARFLLFWLTLLPLGLYDPFSASWNHIALIPATALVSLFLIGIEELANQMEEPFTILPMQAFCDKIYNWLNEIASWEPGDNGMPIYTPSLENTEVLIASELTNGAPQHSVPVSHSSSSALKKRKSTRSKIRKALRRFA
jgi:predicted membrane chloride channel (bestrophin family)